MKIETRDFGTMEVSEDQILEFPNGIYAFEDARRFAFIELEKGQFPAWLQCIDSVKPCFIVFDPWLICKDYEITLNSGEKAMLEVDEKTNLEVLCIARVPEDFKETTVNLKSPIVINMDTKKAMQVILPSNYPYRQPIFKNDETEKEG
ncbi:MAG: flagellar assembly protein FliW [Ruminococcaceae bacterium]|nr:flagellar assembly protein FliW [Oscillospiraceae bacterium]